MMLLQEKQNTLQKLLPQGQGASRISSRLEPSGISRSDGKRPDGATLVPWKCGKLLVWGATCVDTYAPSFSRVASQEAGALADQAERRKSDKYSNMDPNMYLFTPVACKNVSVCALHPSLIHCNYVLFCFVYTLYSLVVYINLPA